MSEQPIRETKLRDLGRLLPRIFTPTLPKDIVWWYHRKYVATNRINPFFREQAASGRGFFLCFSLTAAAALPADVFVGLSAFGWFMHESKRWWRRVCNARRRRRRAKTKQARSRCTFRRAPRTRDAGTVRCVAFVVCAVRTAPVAPLCGCRGC